VGFLGSSKDLFLLQATKVNGIARSAVAAINKVSILLALRFIVFFRYYQSGEIAPIFQKIKLFLGFPHLLAGWVGEKPS
jgi:hypothetical protein